MHRDAVGVYISSVAGGETVRAFVPEPLPPNPPLDLGGTRQTSLERATLALGRLDSISLLLPCEDTGMAFPTASKSMKALMTLGIARELTGQRRNRVFVYDGYLNILNENE